MRSKNMIFLSGILCAGLILMTATCSKKSPEDLTVELLPVEGNPLVNIRVVLNIGSSNDPEGKEGLCYLCLNLLANGGNKTLSYKDIINKFYPMAAYVDLSVDKEMSVLNGTIHTDNLEKFYGIFKEMILNPGFREEDFIRLKTNQLNFLSKTLVNNMDEQFGKEILNLMMYENHPYGHTEAGTVNSVETLTLEDVKTFYKDHFLQGNIIL